MIYPSADTIVFCVGVVALIITTKYIIIRYEKQHEKEEIEMLKWQMELEEKSSKIRNFHLQ